MIIDDKRKMCFIHLHKCGGKTISHILLRPPFNWQEWRRNEFQAHDGVNENPKIAEYKNIVSIRDPIDIYCSKYSNILKGRERSGIKTLDIYDGFQVFYNKILNAPYHSQKKEDNLTMIKRNMLSEKFPTGLVTHQLLFQTCKVESLARYSNIYDFFINENVISHVIRHKNLLGDLQNILGTPVSHVHNNKSNHTKILKEYLSPTQKQDIIKREELFYKFYKGELNDHIRRHRRNDL